MQHKVVAYITRERDGRPELLIFRHRDFPEAGVQVPAGTVEPGESTEAALWREIREESGLSELRLVAKLAEHDFEGNRRHFFYLSATGGLPEYWDWTTNDYHDEAHRARDEPLVFSFAWVDLAAGVELAGDQGRWLHLID